MHYRANIECEKAKQSISGGVGLDQGFRAFIWAVHYILHDTRVTVGDLSW